MCICVYMYIYIYVYIYIYICIYIYTYIGSTRVSSSFPNPVAELACVTRPWSALQEA